MLNLALLLPVLKWFRNNVKQFIIKSNFKDVLLFYTDIYNFFKFFLGFRGLVNQAMTCYLNSLLQALYMTPEFRNALYKWQFDFNANIDESKSIPFQLQKLFLNLQVSSIL